MFVESRLDGVAEPVVQQHCYEAYQDTISNIRLQICAALQVGKLYCLTNRHVNERVWRREQTPGWFSRLRPDVTEEMAGAYDPVQAVFLIANRLK